MREIKFRGKRKDNGEWVTGDFYFFEGANIRHCHQTCHHDEGLQNSYTDYEVTAETVGQFTGLLDIEGKEIFEDDIVLSKKHWRNPYSIRKKWKRFHGLVVCCISQEHGTNEWDVQIGDTEGYGHVFFGPFLDCKVISNIHDAPHLLNPPQRSGSINMTTDPNAPQVNQDQEATNEQANAQESASQDTAMGATDSEEVIEG